MIALVVTCAVLAAAALVKIFERRLPTWAVQAGILVAVLGPLAGAGYGVWSLWQRWVSPVDLVLLVGLLVATGLGSSLGYHRLLTHRALQAGAVTKAVFLALGAMAVPSRPVDWAARHLEHHAHADRPGDPHSPMDGFWHAHVGWILRASAADRERYCRPLMRDPVVMAIDRTATAWVALGLILPAAVDGWRGFVWGGLVRIAIHNQGMFAVNSVCHSFGSRPFRTGDGSRNNLVVALLAFGEGWHNNHHAFPSMAVYGIGWRQPDSTGLVIRALERLGLVWDVRRPGPQALARRLAEPGPLDDPAPVPAEDRGLSPEGRRAHSVTLS